jgi:hypothetical protein
MRSRSILLYGESVLMSLVAQSLGQRPELQVTQAATWTEAGRLLARTSPDALIFDLGGSGESHILPLLLKRSSLLLIGLDAQGNRAVLVSGQEAKSLTLSQIQELVEGS